MAGGGEVTGRAERRRMPPRFLYKIINPVLMTLLRSPLHGRLSGRLAVLTFTGRRSGRRFSTPVGYVQEGETLLIASESRWWRNLVGGASVRLRLRGQERSGMADVVTDEEEMRALYRTMLAAAPDLGQIIGVSLGADGEPRPDEVAAARARGHVVVRVRLDGGTGG